MINYIAVTSMLVSACLASFLLGVRHEQIQTVERQNAVIEELQDTLPHSISPSAYRECVEDLFRSAGGEPSDQ